MQISLTTKTAIIVEDHAIIAMDLRRNIKKWGFNNSIIINSGKKAIYFVENEPLSFATIDIKLSDNISGIEVAKKLKEKYIPFIFISAFSDPVNLQLAQKLNPLAIIKKPLLMEEVDLIIQRFITTH